jgi:hypothetical protein
MINDAGKHRVKKWASGCSEHAAVPSVGAPSQKARSPDAAIRDTSASPDRAGEVTKKQLVCARISTSCRGGAETES